VETFRLPPPVADWIRLTLECELGTDWRHFSALAGLLELGAFLGDGEPCYHVRGGNGRLIAALAAAPGGTKLLSATVTAVERWRTPDGATRARVSYLRGDHAASVEGDRVVLAVPFFRLHQIRFEPPLSDDKWQAILTLDRGQYTVVHLLVDRDAQATWLVNGQSPFPVLTDGPLGVVYGVMHDSPPSQPLQVFSLLVHGSAAAAFHMVPRDVKLREIRAALDRLWPGLSAHVRGAEVWSYHPAAIPVWPPGRSPLDGPARSLREPELGLYLAGDYTLGAHSSAAAESGQAAAARISDELAPASPATTLRSPPAPRREDRPAP
jgi:monoamine oxidase